MWTLNAPSCEQSDKEAARSIGSAFVQGIPLSSRSQRPSGRYRFIGRDAAESEAPVSGIRPRAEASGLDIVLRRCA